MFVLGSVVAKFKFGDLKIGGREQNLRIYANS